MKKGTGALSFVLCLFILLTTLTSHAQVKTVTIGKQVWMKENLNTSTFRNGDPIAQVKTATEWEKAFENGTPAWCYYDNDPENGKLYGKLYNGYAISDSRGLAPAGWHIPSDGEWTILTQYLGGMAVAGPKLIIPGEFGGTNTSGFDGRLAGIRPPGGDFAGMGGGTMWGSSTIEKARMSWCVSVNVIGELDRYPINWAGGSSVRCIKDVQSMTEKPKPIVKPKPVVVPNKPIKN